MFCTKPGPCARSKETCQETACLYLLPKVFVFWNRGDQHRTFGNLPAAIQFARKVDGIVVS